MNLIKSIIIAAALPLPAAAQTVEAWNGYSVTVSIDIERQQKSVADEKAAALCDQRGLGADIQSYRVDLQTGTATAFYTCSPTE